MAEYPFPKLLDQASLKIQWAMFHWHQLRNSFDMYSKQGVRLRLLDQNAMSATFVCEADPLPYQNSLAVGTIIQSLRSALDTAVSRLYHEATGKFHERINFPTHLTERELKAHFETGNGREIAKELPDLTDLILNEFKPWKEANFELWALTRLDNIQKHRVIPLVVGMVIFRVHKAEKAGVLFHDNVIALEPGTMHKFGLGGVVDLGELTTDHDTTVLITCPVIEEFFPDKPLMETLKNLTDLLMGVIDTLETHFKRSDAN